MFTAFRALTHIATPPLPSPCSSRRTPSAPLSRLPSVAPVLFPSCSSNSPPSSRRRPESSPHLSSISFMKRLTLVTLNLAAPMAWYTSAAPTRLVLLVVASLLPTVSAQLPKLMPLSAGKMSSDSTSARTSHGSVSNSPNRPPAPLPCTTTEGCVASSYPTAYPSQLHNFYGVRHQSSR